MQIEKAAVAGTLESSDCMVTVEDGDGNIDLVLESTVIHQYGNQIRHVVLDTLENLGVQNVKIKIVAINEQISNFAQTYPTNLKASSNEALLFMRRYRFANCSCFSCCFKDAYPSSNVQ